MKLIKEDITDFLKPKSKEDIYQNIDQDKIELIIDCYELIQKYSNKFTIVDELGINKYSQNNYTYSFKFIVNNKDNIFCIIELDNKQYINLYVYTDGYFDCDRQINSLDDIIFYFNLYEPLHEQNIFKPKSETDIKKITKKIYPTFTKIFNELFPNEEFNVDNHGDIYFTFSIKDKNNNDLTFLVQQYFNFRAPQISFLDKSKSNKELNLGGFFVNTRRIFNTQDIEKYVESYINK